MSNRVRMAMAGVAGVGSAFLVVAAIELVAHAVYAPSVMPDVSTPEAMAAYVDSMPLGAFLFVLAAYVAGTVVGGFVGIAIARRHAMRFACLAGGCDPARLDRQLRHDPAPDLVRGRDARRHTAGRMAHRAGRAGLDTGSRRVGRGHFVERVTCATATVRFRVPTIATSTSAARSRPAPRRGSG